MSFSAIRVEDKVSDKEINRRWNFHRKRATKLWRKTVKDTQKHLGCCQSDDFEMMLSTLINSYYDSILKKLPEHQRMKATAGLHHVVVGTMIATMYEAMDGDLTAADEIYNELSTKIVEYEREKKQ